MTLFDELMTGLVPGLPKAQTRMLAMPWVLGQFVMTWAKHERMLASMLARLQQVDYCELRDKLLDGKIIGYEYEIKRTFDILGDEHSAAPYLSEILKGHVRLRQLRHDIVHGYLATIGPDEEYLLKRKVRKKAEIVRTLTLEELWEGYQSLDDLGASIVNAGLVFDCQDPIGQAASPGS
ncbi:MAG: hypothetical protein ABIO85_02505 [Sphingomicrobium sp.]